MDPLRNPTDPLMPAGLGAVAPPVRPEQPKRQPGMKDFPTAQQRMDLSAKRAAEAQQEWANERTRLQEAVALAKSDLATVSEMPTETPKQRLKRKAHRIAGEQLVAEAEQALERHLAKNNRRGGVTF